MFSEGSLGKINAKNVKLFRNGSVHEFYCLKAYITLKQLNTLVVEIKKNLYEQNFDAKANWWGVVNFHFMRTSLVMSMRYIFGDAGLK